jgi:acetyl-CoA carboxylase biotin carboxyl carrier protein
MDLTNEDVADVLALLDSLPYDELDLQTTRFRLVLRRTPDGWTQAVESRAAPSVLDVAPAAPTAPGGAEPGGTEPGGAGPEADGADEAEGSGGAEGGAAGDFDGELVAVRAPLPGTFYRAPRPGAAPFVEVGSRVDRDTVVGIVETMKLMNSVTAGVDGMVAEICLENAEFAANGATLLRVRAD